MVPSGNVQSGGYSVVQRGISAPPIYPRGLRFKRRFKDNVNPRDGTDIFDGVVVNVEKRFYMDWFQAWFLDGDILEINARHLRACVERYGSDGIAVGEELADYARKYEAEHELREAEKRRRRQAERAEHNMAVDEQQDGTGGEPLADDAQQDSTGGEPLSPPRQAGPGQGVGSAATAQHTGVDDGTSTCMEIGGHAVLSTAGEGGTSTLSFASDAVPAQQGPAQGIDTTRPVVLSAMAAAAPPSQGPEQPGSTEHGAASIGDGPERTQADAIGSAEGGNGGHPGATAEQLLANLSVNMKGIAGLISASIQAIEEIGYTPFSREDAFVRTPFLLC